jgi:DNA-binding CsgD family transcriptional regulator/Flp pilus assembly protein TadD
VDLAEQLRILQAAGENQALLVLSMVDLAHHALPAAKRSRVKDALLAAAVPHWCDGPFLAALLKTTAEDGDYLLGQLRALTVVEAFPARGEHAVNVHEAARLVLRDHVRTTDAQYWKILSNRALSHVSRSIDAHSRIEALYHLFATDQHAAATVCGALEKEFADSGHAEVRRALALTLTELVAAGWLTGAAQVEALLVSLELRKWRGEVAQLEDEVRNVAALARSASHPYGTCRAQVLLGDVFRTKGRLDDALTAFHEALAIVKLLTATDPSNADWQRDLAVAHSKIGDIAQAQGRLDDALTAFHEALAIVKLLTATDPSNADWQRDLAVAHSKIGDIAQAQGRLEDALNAFYEVLAISQRLAATDPSNADWQRDLAVAHSKIGDIARARGHLDAIAAYWQRALALEAQGRLDDPNSMANDELRSQQQEPKIESARNRPALTPREKQIIRWVAEGKTNREISIILGVSTRTVKFHLKRVYEKLGGVENRWAAVVGLVAEGKTNKEIADSLRLSDETVKLYLTNVYQTLPSKG